MNKIIKSDINLYTCWCIHSHFAQKAGRDFKDIDEYVKKLGRLDSMNMGSIATLLTKNYEETKQIKQEPFYMDCYQISVWLQKCPRSGNNDKNTPARY